MKQNDEKYAELINDVTYDLLIKQGEGYKKIKDDPDSEFSYYITDTTATFLALICYRAAQCIYIENKDKDIKAEMNEYFDHIVKVAKELRDTIKIELPDVKAH